MSNLVAHAQHELRLAGWYCEDALYGTLLPESVISMIECFAEAGHSGMSAGLAISLFEKLARFETLTALTGEDDEWRKLNFGCEPLYQNKRCSNVFKTTSGRAYDVNGRIFRTPNGDCYTNMGSYVDVTFPYWPKREYVDVPE